MESQKELNMEKYLKETDLNLKARFFALYWGQKCGKNKYGNLSVNKSNILNITHLELKPLSQISDEDASKVCDLIFITNNNLNIQQIKQIVILIESNNWNNYKIFDYLRSKGYALPWMDLSVEDLVEYGWIKLKEN